MKARSAITIVFFVDGALFASSAPGQPGVATVSALATVSMLGYTGFLAGPPIVGGVAAR